MKKPMPIRKVAAPLGGIPALADALGIHRTAPHFWKKRGVPVSRAHDVSRLTGHPLHELRPDVWTPPLIDLPAKNGGRNKKPGNR